MVRVGSGGVYQTSVKGWLVHLLECIQAALIIINAALYLQCDAGGSPLTDLSVLLLRPNFSLGIYFPNGNHFRTYIGELGSIFYAVIRTIVQALWTDAKSKRVATKQQQLE